MNIFIYFFISSFNEQTQINGQQQPCTRQWEYLSATWSSPWPNASLTWCFCLASGMTSLSTSALITISIRPCVRHYLSQLHFSKEFSFLCVWWVWFCHKWFYIYLSYSSNTSQSTGEHWGPNQNFKFIPTLLHIEHCCTILYKWFVWITAEGCTLTWPLLIEMHTKWKLVVISHPEI